MQSKMTIEDIAEKAGVGKATVSRVLNHTGYVSEKTRKKIERVIENCDYVPSATARNFARQDSNMVAVIVPEPHNPYFARLWREFQECWMKRAALDPVQFQKEFPKRRENAAYTKTAETEGNNYYARNQ